MIRRFKKTRLAAAMLATVGAAGLSTQAQAVNLATDGIGDVAIVPYYTVRGGWQTLINLTNTSAYTIAVKIRFHESFNSRDVLDFNVILSPFDVWAGSLSASNGGAVFNVASDDTTCTSPLNVDGLLLNAAAYTNGNADGGPTSDDRLTEGYIVIESMGHADPSSGIGALANHNHATFDCVAVDNGFLQGNIQATKDQFGEPINVLKVNFNLLNAEDGIAAGGEALHLANFFNADGNPFEGPGTIQGPAVAPGACAGGQAPLPGGTCINLITAQEPFFFLDPTLNNAFPPIGWVMVDGDPGAQGSPTLPSGFVRGIDAVSFVLQRSSLLNEWSVNPVLAVTTDWVVTFPTKAFYVDADDTTPQAAISRGRPNAGWLDAQTPGPMANPGANGTGLGAMPLSPFAEIFHTEWSDPPVGPLSVSNGESCNEVQVAVNDREEQQITGGGTVPSPAPRITRELCYETNVLTFNDGNVLSSQVPQNIDTSALSQPFGWMDLDLTTEGSGVIGTSPTPLIGLPVTGFMIKVREFGPVTAHFGFLAEHGYRRFTSYLMNP